MAALAGGVPGRGEVWREGIGLQELVVRASVVAGLVEEAAELEVDLEGGSGVGPGGGGEVLAEERDGEGGVAIGVDEDAPGVDEDRAAELVEIDGGTGGGFGLRALATACVEGAEVDPGSGGAAGGGASEFRFGRGHVVCLFGKQGEDAMAESGCSGLVRGFEAGGEVSRLSGAATDDGGRGDVELTEIAGGGEIAGVESGGAFEGVANLARDREGDEWISGAGSHALCTAEPDLYVAAAGVGCCRGFALSDGVLGELFGVEGAAKEKVSFGVGRVGVEPLPELGRGVLDTTSLERCSGAGNVRVKRWSEEESKGEVPGGVMRKGHAIRQC